MNQKDLIYVGLQFLLFVLFIFIGGNDSIGFSLNIIGFILAILGLLIIIISLLQLNKNLSPFPTPREEGELVTIGLYSIVRHPIYLGILTLFLGYSLYCGNGGRLLITIALAILFHFKSEYEERLLEQKFSNYSNYKNSTFKIFPGLL